MAKEKLCKWDGCGEVVANLNNNSTIKSKYCYEHLTASTLSKVRLNQTKQANIEHKAKVKDTAKKKIDLMSTDEYRSKYVQPLINEIARLIDHGQPCIATGTFGKMSGGHYFAVGHNRTTCLHLDNIHVQSFHSNSANGGDNIRYRDGIIKTYGIAYMERIEALKQTPPLHLSKDDLKTIKEIATEIVKYLRVNLKVRTPEERIQLRSELNDRLNIY